MTWQNEGLGYNTHKYSRDAPIQSIGLVLVVILTLLSGLRFGQTSGSTLNIVLNIGFFFFINCITLSVTFIKLQQATLSC